MDLGTIDHREPAVLPCKSKKQICAAEDHSLGALFVTQPPSDREEDATLRIGDTTRNRHLEIVAVHLFERVTLWQDNPCGADPAIKCGLHNHSGAKYPDCIQIPPPNHRFDLGDCVEDRQRRNSHQLLDAKMSAHRSDGSELGAC